jgi:hypothetical protein
VGALAWAAVVVELGPQTPTIALLGALLPVVALVVWVCSRLTRPGVQLSVVALVLGGAGTIAALVQHELRERMRFTEVAHASERLLIVVALLALGGLALMLAWRIKQAKRLDKLEGDKEINVLGIVSAATAGMSMGLVLSVGVAALGAGPIFAQLGYTLCAAATGLGLLIAGLRWQQPTWRQIGLSVIAVGAVKVVLVDLAEAAVAWRAVGFAGIGLVLIAGAFAYSRAQQRFVAAQAPAEDPGLSTEP